jgi:ketol-acid reductoisomerase
MNGRRKRVAQKGIDMKIFRESDLSDNVLAGRTIAVVGYGNQGHAHALNLRDSGVRVRVGARLQGSSWRRAQADDFEPLPTAQAVETADCIAVLLPDEVQESVFARDIGPYLKPGASLIFAHGFTIAFGLIDPPAGHDIILVAPKGQGHYLRKMYKRGDSLPCLVGIERDDSGKALRTALSYAAYLGCLAAGAIETSFREEAVTDLFGEQVVLCGGVPDLVKAAFETLVEAGYHPQVAYLECLHELKIIADLLHRKGIAAMKERISRTAAWGSFQTGKRIVSPSVRDSMKQILQEIESGRFAEGWREEARGGQERLRKAIDAECGHSIEEVGRKVRALMDYLNDE